MLHRKFSSKNREKSSFYGVSTLKKFFVDPIFFSEYSVKSILSVSYHFHGFYYFFSNFEFLHGLHSTQVSEECRTQVFEEPITLNSYNAAIASFP